jgi:hypothetical protein
MLCVILLTACLFSATAGEIVRFKNGHQMVVRKSQIDGDTIFLTLEDGSVLGFPKELVQIEGNTPTARYYTPVRTNRVTRGPTAARHRQARDGTLNMIPSEVIPTSELEGRSVMMGYNRPGAGRVSTDEVLQKTSQGKSGTTFGQARQQQQGRDSRPAEYEGGSAAEPSREVPKVRPIFTDDKKAGERSR